MSYRRKIMAFFCSVSLMASLAACGASAAGNSGAEGIGNAEGNADDAKTVQAVISAKEQLAGFSVEELFTTRDLEGSYEENRAVRITLADAASSGASDSVKIEHDTVTITEGGVYLISGGLSDGQIVVDAGEDKVQLVLAGVSVTNASTAAIYVRQADKVFVTLAEGTENTLSVSGAFAAIDENNIDAVIFSKDDLCLNGSGALAVSCADGHGVVSKDDLKVTGGSYEITATGHALSGKDSVRIAGGSFILKSGTSAICSENEENEEKGYVYIAGGDFAINSDGKGVNATAGVYLIDGSYEIHAADDTIHSDADCIVEAGVYALASGDDGIHAGGNLLIDGGSIRISESYEGLEGVTVTINDGDIQIVSSDDGINAAGGTGDGADMAERSDLPQGADDGSRSQPPQDMDSRNGGRGFENSGERPNFGNSDTSQYQLVINGGLIRINANGDGMDSNGTITINGGSVFVSGPTDNGNAALDSESGMTVNGGTVIAAGSSGMAENFGSDSTQGAILLTYDSSRSGAITLCDADGNELVSYTPEKTYTCVQISCGALTVGESYVVTSGDDAQTIELTELICGQSGWTGMMGGPGWGGFGGQPFDRPHK